MMSQNYPSLNSTLIKKYKNINVKQSNDILEMKFFGLSSDGTVSANKNSIKIIGESTEKFIQGYQNMILKNQEV